MPARILSVFPAGTMDAPLKLDPLDGHTKVPYHDVHFEVVRSHGFFIADHLSVLSDSAGARHAFWDRADRFFAPLVAG